MVRNLNASIRLRLTSKKLKGLRVEIRSVYKTFIIISCIIAGLGAFNWLLSNYNLNVVKEVVTGKTAERIIYFIIGLCGVFTIIGALQWSRKKMIYDSETGKKLEYFRNRKNCCGRV